MGSVTEIMPALPIVERDEQERWALRIRAACQKSVEAILETGRLLIEAKAALPHGSFEIMVRDQLPFSVRTAQRFMAIAENPVLSNATHASLLPASWNTLYELSRWQPDELALGLKHAAFINPGIRREEVPTLHKRIRSKLGIKVRWSKRAGRDNGPPANGYFASKGSGSTEEEGTREPDYERLRERLRRHTDAIMAMLTECPGDDGWYECVRDTLLSHAALIARREFDHGEVSE